MIPPCHHFVDCIDKLPYEIANSQSQLLLSTSAPRPCVLREWTFYAALDRLGSNPIPQVDLMTLVAKLDKRSMNIEYSS